MDRGAWRATFIGCKESDTTEVTYAASDVKRLPTMWDTQVQSLGWEDLLEKEMATHSSILAWKIPWTETFGGRRKAVRDRLALQGGTGDAQGVSGPSSSCVWNPRVFADDARGWQCPFVLCLHPQGCLRLGMNLVHTQEGRRENNLPRLKLVLLQFAPL